MKSIQVVAAIIHSDDMILATQRGYGEYEGWWEFPGGKMERGETREVALVREIWEELGSSDLLHATAIRLLVFNDRVEIINPGCLFGGLQVEDIKLGVSRQRNPLMAALAGKTMIYRGLGSGIIRVMKENIQVDFINEESSNQFKTIIWRTIQKDSDTTQKSENTTQKTIQKSKITIQKDLTTTQKEVLEFFRNHPKAKREEAIQMLNVTEGGVKFIIGKLQRQGLLKREGGRKNGYWVVIDNKE